jgi:hypothetical protein
VNCFRATKEEVRQAFQPDFAASVRLESLAYFRAGQWLPVFSSLGEWQYA